MSCASLKKERFPDCVGANAVRAGIYIANLAKTENLAVKNMRQRPRRPRAKLPL